MQITPPRPIVANRPFFGQGAHPAMQAIPPGAPPQSPRNELLTLIARLHADAASNTPEALDVKKFEDVTESPTPGNFLSQHAFIKLDGIHYSLHNTETDSHKEVSLTRLVRYIPDAPTQTSKIVLHLTERKDSDKFTITSNLFPLPFRAEDEEMLAPTQALFTLLKEKTGLKP